MLHAVAVVRTTQAGLTFRSCAHGAAVAATAAAVPRCPITIRLNDVVYVHQYEPEWCLHSLDVDQLLSYMSYI